MEYVPGTEIEKPVVRLIGEDGNAALIMARVKKALKRAGVPKSVIEKYLAESKSGDYDNLLQTAIKYADCE